MVAKQKYRHKKLERIKTAATELAPRLIDKSYEERLLELNLTTLEQRRERGVLNAVYRVLKGMEKLDRSDFTGTQEIQKALEKNSKGISTEETSRRIVFPVLQSNRNMEWSEKRNGPFEIEKCI